MLVIEKKEKPKQGRIQRGFVKGGGEGGDDTSPLPNETFSWNYFFLSKRDVALKLSTGTAPSRCPCPGLCNLVGSLKNLLVLIYPKLHEKNHVITYNNSTVLGIIRKKEAGGVTKTVFYLLQQHVPGAVKVTQTWRPQMMFL